jgi:hypothetical protein
MTCRFPARQRFHSCTVSLLILHGGTISLATERGTTTTRVRSDHPVIAGAIADAAEHSATFRSMVEAIEETDGIVYVREGPCRLGVRACLAESLNEASSGGPRSTVPPCCRGEC